MVTWVSRRANRLYEVCKRHSSPVPPGWPNTVASTSRMRLCRLCFPCIPREGGGGGEGEEAASSSASSHNSHRLACLNRLRQAASDRSAKPSSTAQAPNIRKDGVHRA